MLTNGKYIAVARSWDVGESKEKGTPLVNVNYEIVAGPNSGQFISGQHYITEGAVEFTIKALRASGWSGVNCSDPNDLGGMGTRKVELVVEAESYEGKSYPKVKFVNAPGGGFKPKPLDESKKRQLAAMLKVESAKVPVLPPDPKPEREPGSDDGGPESW
jgi:hypothetical protein